MNRESLFISNYSRIEHDVIELSHSIEFCDEQTQIYSTVICDLIIRCCTDIESLYKELYKRMVSRNLPKTVGEIALEINRRLNLASKVLDMDNREFNFNTFNTISPFGYKKKSEDDFYDTFCRLKHDRYESLQKATLRTLILSLGALYILDQYYLDEQKVIENSFFGETMPIVLSKDTHIFSARVFNGTWSAINLRFNILKEQSGIAEEDICLLKSILTEKTILEPSPMYTQLECLFKIEMTREYKQLINSSSEGPGCGESREILIHLLFGNNKDVDALLDKYGTGVLDAILSLYNTIVYRNRFMITMNVC